MIFKWLGISCPSLNIAGHISNFVQCLNAFPCPSLKWALAAFQKWSSHFLYLAESSAEYFSNSSGVNDTVFFPSFTFSIAFRIRSLVSSFVSFLSKIFLGGSSTVTSMVSSLSKSKFSFLVRLDNSEIFNRIVISIKRDLLLK
jgi:hypothetical protein